MAAFLRLSVARLLVACLVLCSGGAFADTLSANPPPDGVGAKLADVFMCGRFGPGAKDTVCSAFAASDQKDWNDANPGLGIQVRGDTSQGYCQTLKSSPGYAEGPDGNGCAFAPAGQQAGCQDVPNSIIAVDSGGGAYCHCQYGRDGAGCAPKPAPHNCNAAGTYQPDPPGSRYVFDGLSASTSTPFCNNGCGATPAAVAVGGDGTAEYGYGGTYSTGTSCGANSTVGAPNPSPTPLPAGNTPPDTHCSGATACSGTVNGATVCVACGTPSTQEGSQTTQNNPDGSTTTSNTSTNTVNNPDGSKDVTTTTTTTTTGAGGVGGSTQSSSTTTTHVPAGANGSGSNGGGGAGAGGGTCTGSDCGNGTDSFGGSCSASFTCDGDAVQCSIALEQHQRDCAMFDPGSAGGVWAHGNQTLETAKADGDNPGWSPANIANHVVTNFDWSTTIDQSATLAAGCPSDVTLGNGVVLRLSSLCPYLGWLGTFIVAMTSIACAFILFKGTK